MSNIPEPPTAKYRLTLTITGNSHDEIERELLSMTRGGYLNDSDYHQRDEFKVIGGRRTATLEHTNPEMTPARYGEELRAWWEARKAARRESGQADASLLIVLGCVLGMAAILLGAWIGTLR